jgi:hypothetical protein
MLLSKAAIFLFLNPIVSAIAQRVTHDDIYGNSAMETGAGSGGGIFDYLALVIFFGGLIWLFIKDGKFRLGATIYIAVLAGLIFVFTAFGKEKGLIACAVVMVVAWFLDPTRKK